MLLLRFSKQERGRLLMKLLKSMLLLCLTLAVSTACQTAVSSEPASKADPQAEPTKLKELVGKYKESINAADAALGASLFSKSSEVSFIHPRGHERGWDAIQKGIYGMFADNFTKRELKSSDERINVYGDTAWVEFYWVFDATLKDNSPLQTKGRETQIWKREAGQWRIVHVHYSGMPVTAPRQGF
jgi:ketosteroid isomerase-like protein